MNENKRDIQTTLEWINKQFIDEFEIDSYNPDGKAKRYKLGYNYGESNGKFIPAYFRFFGAKAFSHALSLSLQMLEIYVKEQNGLRRVDQDVKSEVIQNYKDENDKLRKRNEQLEAKVKVADKRYLRCLGNEKVDNE